MNSFVTAFLYGLIPAAVLAWPVYRALLALKARQTVSQHVAEHAHKQGTPTMGGLMILCGLIPSAAWVTMAGDENRFGMRTEGILILIIGYALIGFVDDFVVPRLLKGKRGLGWGQKLLLQIGVATIAGMMLSPISGLALAFGVFCVLFFSNAYNFTDGLDWLAGTVLLALASGGAYMAYLLGAPEVTELFVGLVGATLPFMVMNRPPAKIFMGDVGSMPIGGIFGLGFAAIAWPGVTPALGSVPVKSLLADSTGPVWLTQPREWIVWAAIVVISVVMMMELLPVPIQIASVKLRKKKVFPMTPIHHAYQKAGWKETRIVAMFFSIQVACALIAVAMAYFGAQESRKQANIAMERGGRNL
ncbi:MAG: hypothetical protein ACO1SV_15410 [Fimbriimonas sp.]